MNDLQFETPEAAEAFELMMQLFEDRIEPAGMSRLDLALRQHASVRRLFVRVAHQYCALVPLIAAQGHVDRPSLFRMGNDFDHHDGRHDVLAETLLSEAMILPALQETHAEDEQDESFNPQPISSQLDEVQNPAGGIYRRWYRLAMVFAVALLVAVVAVASHRHRENVELAIRQPVQQVVPMTPNGIAPEPALATITATAGTEIRGPDAISPRTDIGPGQVFRLKGGAVELKFASGASVLVRGPAQVQVIDRNTLAIATGSLYAHVPSSAIGFRVIAPGLGVVDRGTNFGVRVTQGGSTSEVHVFEGRVDATALDAGGNPSGLPIPVQSPDAVAHSASSPVADLMKVQFEPSAFDRDINRIQVEVPSHGTGTGLDIGSTDPWWQLISVPDAPDWKPIAAFVVLDPRPEYVPNSGIAKWISLSPHMRKVSGGEYVYRTSIDLNGFDPASVSVQANFAVDDSIRQIRVNGHAVSLPADLTLGLDRMQARTTWHQLSISNVNWTAGPNQVDVVVWNLTGVVNFTALQLSWSVVASPVVIR